jgi:PAS domain S-box-containing protein
MMNQEIIFMILEAIDNIHDGIVIVDKNSKIIYVNTAYSEILHVNKDKVLNKFVSKIEPGAIILDSLKEKKPKINTVVKVKTRGKEILVNINPIIIEGKLLGAVSIFKDVTEVSLLNKELEQVRKLTGYLYNDSTKFHKNSKKLF